MQLANLQEQCLEDLDALLDREISVSEARARAVLAKNIIEAEKVELARSHMIANGTMSAATHTAQIKAVS